MLFFLFTSTVPFANTKLNYLQVLERVKNGVHPQIPTDLPEEFSQLILALWKYEKQSIPTLLQRAGARVLTLYAEEFFKIKLALEKHEIEELVRKENMDGT